MAVKSAGKNVFEATELHKIIFIKNLLDCSGGYLRSVAKNQSWHLDTDPTTVTADARTNPGITARGAVAHGGNTVETLVPLNRYFFLEELADLLLPPMQLESEVLLQDDN